MTVTDANSPTTADTPLVVNCGLGEQDFRQKYHPMVGKNDDDDDTGDDDMQHENEPKKQYNVLSGEMDLIFVGTASCTPGTTRGVSCTALRLNMGRGGGGTGGSSNNSPSLGTWLFDVGEATQVSRVTKHKTSFPGKQHGAKDEIRDAGTSPRHALLTCVLWRYSSIKRLILNTNSDAPVPTCFFSF